jgi:hypothetical protein
VRRWLTIEADFHAAGRLPVLRGEAGMFSKFVAAAALAAVLAPVSCEASTIAFNVDTTTFDIKGQAVLSDSLNAVGGHDVESISGLVTGPSGGAITGPIANPTQPGYYNNGSWIYDNVVYPSAPSFDYWGLLFSAGGYDYNIFTSGSTGYLSTNNPQGVFNPGEVVLAASVAAIPEASSWAMMLAGFAALGFAGYRSSRRSVALFA